MVIRLSVVQMIHALVSVLQQWKDKGKMEGTGSSSEIKYTRLQPHKPLN